MEPWLVAVLCVATFLIGAVGFGFVMYRKGIERRKRDAEAQFESAEKEAAKIVSEAKEKAATAKKTALLEAKDEIYKLRENAEKDVQRLRSQTEAELKERRIEVSKSERRLLQKEENLDKKTDKIERLEESLTEKNNNAKAKLEKAEQLVEAQLQMLEKISGFTAEQARNISWQSWIPSLFMKRRSKSSLMSRGSRTNATKRRDRLFLLLFPALQAIRFRK